MKKWLVLFCSAVVFGCASTTGLPELPKVADVCNAEFVDSTDQTVVDKEVKKCRVDYALDVASSNAEAALFWVNSMAARGRVDREVVGKAIEIGERFQLAAAAVEGALSQDQPDTALGLLVKVNEVLLELEAVQQGVEQ